MHSPQFNAQPRILPAVRSVSEVVLNYTKRDRYVAHFYNISQAKRHAEIHASDREERIFTVALDDGKARENESSGNYDGCCLIEIQRVRAA
jgi:hypothetical protein